MAHTAIAKFRNDLGLTQIAIGAKKFECTGATAPHDHPHIFLDMGEDDQIICPYCSTLFKHDKNLGTAQANPEACAYAPGETA